MVKSARLVDGSSVWKDSQYLWFEKWLTRLSALLRFEEFLPDWLIFVVRFTRMQFSMYRSSAPVVAHHLTFRLMLDGTGMNLRSLFQALSLGGRGENIIHCQFTKVCSSSVHVFFLWTGSVFSGNVSGPSMIQDITLKILISKELLFPSVGHVIRCMDRSSPFLSLHVSALQDNTSDSVHMTHRAM